MSEDLTKGLPHDGTEQILTLLRGVDARLTRLEERLTSLDDGRPVDLEYIRMRGDRITMSGHLIRSKP